MDLTLLAEIAKKLVDPQKGILAADQSPKSVEKLFALSHTQNTEEERRSYRQLMFTAPGIDAHISGVILHDETVFQKTDDGKSLPQLLSERGIIAGIKVDKGRLPLALFQGEDVTRGLDDLRERLEEYKKNGVQFTKWRGAIRIGEQMPTAAGIHSNTHALARYAAIVQEAGMVPIVEPETLVDGSHDIARCKQVTTKVLESLFAQLFEHKVQPEGLILKVNFVVPGKDSSQDVSPEDVARETLDVLKQTTSVAVPGVIFLSGGLSPEISTTYLNEVVKQKDAHAHPWQLTFSYGRALQEPVLETWQGKEENISNAQEVLLKRAQLNALARQGKYTADMEG